MDSLVGLKCKETKKFCPQASRVSLGQGHHYF